MKGNMKKYKGTQSLCRRGRGESSGFFLDPKGYIEGGRGGGGLGIFPSPKASMEEIKSGAYIGGGSKSFYRGKELGIFPTPKVFLGKMKKYGGNMTKYEGIYGIYEENMTKYIGRRT